MPSEPPAAKPNDHGPILRACRDAGRIVVFAPARLTLASGSLALLRGIIRGLRQRGMADIILDLSGCVYVDSAGIGELVSAFTFCSNSGGSFSLNRAQKKIHDLLQITKLYTVFNHFNIDYSRHPLFELSPQDTSALVAARDTATAGPTSLFLTVREGRIQLLPGRIPGLYRISVGADPHQGLILAAPYIIADITRTYLHEEIEEFEYLLNSSSCTEAAIQQFLESHPKFLLGQEYERLYPHVILERGDEGPLIPDFLLQPFGKRFCDVLDIKLPTAQLVVGGRNRKRFSAAVAEASAQLRQYRDFFEDPHRRDSVLQRYGVTAYRPRLAVVVGKKAEIDDDILYKQIQDGISGVEVITYEDLLTRAKKFLLL